MNVVDMALSYSTDDLVAEGLMVKACPFCGSLGVEAINTRCASPWFVVCDRCRAIGPRSETLEMAVALWNGRLTDAVSIVPWNGKVHEAKHRAVHCGNGQGEDAA